MKAAFVLLVLPWLASVALAEQLWHFQFGGSRPVGVGQTWVRSVDVWDATRGYGWEPGFALDEQADSRSGKSTSYFTVKVPREGNYRVTVFWAGSAHPGRATVKAELRRLMLQQIDCPVGGTSGVFTVNVRSPQIAPANGVVAGLVNLKAPRETTQEAWAWDNALTLEFSGEQNRIEGLRIETAPAGPTLYLLGDSTVCDQSREPYASWGQMLPRFFGPEIAVANHAESGETYRDSLARRRLDKIISVMRPGDCLLMQFGHNDQKQIAAGSGAPFTTYADEMRQHIAAVKKVGGIPVVVSPMERRGFEPDGSVSRSLADYAAASARVAAEEGVAYIDLNARSRTLYAALGQEGSATAFAAPNGRLDNTHHNNYGAWLLAACVVDGLRSTVPGLGQYLRIDLPPFDPARPPAEAAVWVPPSALVTTVRPLGD